jgi:hypothetical protein
MNPSNKPTPMVSPPDNWSFFNGCEVQPWAVTRAEAAASLREHRGLCRKGLANMRREAAGRYRLWTFNTVILNTRAGPSRP